MIYYINHVILIYVQTLKYKLHYKHNLKNKKWFDPHFYMYMIQNNIYKDLKNSSSLVIAKRFTEQLLLQPKVEFAIYCKETLALAVVRNLR